uniref:Uncharacterized protein n=1 Tax=Myotis myotis TaxID=51298 RepID=A0A7J7QVV3_MYOMY|nr:hypothetical protein mMyoMyo1_011296 [Myotis myotis]
MCTRVGGEWGVSLSPAYALSQSRSPRGVSDSGLRPTGSGPKPAVGHPSCCCGGGRGPATAAPFTSLESGFWPSGAPTEHTDHRGAAPALSVCPLVVGARHSNQLFLSICILAFYYIGLEARCTKICTRVGLSVRPVPSRSLGPLRGPFPWLLAPVFLWRPEPRPSLFAGRGRCGGRGA